MNWIINRLHEPSTWRGLIWLLTACGVTVRPEIWEQITTIGMAAAGLLGVLTREGPTRVEISLPPIDLVGQTGMADGAGPVADCDPASTPVRLRQSVRARHNTDEASDVDPRPGFNG